MCIFLELTEAVPEFLSVNRLTMGSHFCFVIFEKFYKPVKY